MEESKAENVINIIKDMNIKREKCYSTNGILNFKTKAFIVVKSQSEAQKYIETIRGIGYKFEVKK